MHPFPTSSLYFLFLIALFLLSAFLFFINLPSRPPLCPPLCLLPSSLSSSLTSSLSFSLPSSLSSVLLSVGDDLSRHRWLYIAPAIAGDMILVMMIRNRRRRPLSSVLLSVKSYMAEKSFVHLKKNAMEIWFTVYTST